MNIPSFIIIGAYRSGTTSLYNYICQHQDIKKAKVKEINYFSNYLSRGEQWYYSRFQKNCITGEASPSYMSCQTAIYNMIPLCCLNNIKIISVLRNPIDRALSHCVKFNVGLEESIKYGMYAKQLKPFKKFFNVLTIQSEKYFDCEQSTLNRVYDFIGVNRHTLKLRQYNCGNYTNSQHSKWLEEYYKPHNDNLWNLIGEKWNW